MPVPTGFYKRSVQEHRRGKRTMTKKAKFVFGSFAILFTSAIAAGCGDPNGGRRAGISPVTTQFQPGVPPSGPAAPNPSPSNPNSDGFAETQADAFELQLGWTSQGNIEHTQDRDWYKVLINAGDTVAFVATATTPGGGIWLSDGNGLVEHGPTATLTLTRSTTGYVYMFIEDEWWTATPSYQLTVNKVTSAAPTAPTVDPVTVQLVFGAGVPREVPANGFTNVIELSITANRDIKSVKAAQFSFNRPTTCTQVSASSPNLWQVGQVTPINGFITVIGPQPGTTLLPLVENEKGGIALYADLQGLDNVNLITYLDWIEVELTDGSTRVVNVNLSETVLVEAVPDTAHLHLSATVAQVASGQVGQVGEFESRNRDRVHSVDLYQIDVARLTDGDTNQLEITDLSGLNVAYGQNYTSYRWDGSQWILEHRVSFWIPAGKLPIAPAQQLPGSVRWRLMAHTTGAHQAEYKYGIVSIASRNDNGQVLYQYDVMDKANGDYVEFTIQLQ